MRTRAFLATISICLAFLFRFPSHASPCFLREHPTHEHFTHNGRAQSPDCHTVSRRKLLNHKIDGQSTDQTLRAKRRRRTARGSVRDEREKERSDPHWRIARKERTHVVPQGLQYPCACQAARDVPRVIVRAQLLHHPPHTLEVERCGVPGIERPVHPRHLHQRLFPRGRR